MEIMIFHNCILSKVSLLSMDNDSLVIEDALGVDGKGGGGYGLSLKTRFIFTVAYRKICQYLIK